MKADKYIPIEEVFLSIKTDPQMGLAGAERQERHSRLGPNQLETKASRSAFLLLLSQFGDIMVLMLLGATLISAALGEYYDALVIMFIVVLNAILGFAQEFKAERSLEALQDLASPRAQVLCNGEIITVPASTLVPGDIVYIRAGDKIPADLRLFADVSFEVEESPLTGETLPVRKQGGGKGAESMAYMGCLATRGRSSGVVVAIGMDTMMGSIAGMLQQAQQPPTPLQTRLQRLGRVLVVACLFISALVTVAGALRGEGLYKMFMAGVSLAVAAIPEGLPAVVTLCLAIGLQRMLRRRAIVRKLPAVETLGCATVICSDKTGTLTQNQMTVQRLFMGGKVHEVTGRGYNPQGELVGSNQARREHMHIMGMIGSLCNNAVLKQEAGAWKVIGDPTDGALLVLARKLGFAANSWNDKYRLIDEQPFDSAKKMMASVVEHHSGTKYALLAKGAPEVIINRCSEWLAPNGVRPLDVQIKGRISTIWEQWAEQSYRVLALAWKQTTHRPDPEADANTGMIFAGLVALDDPPRPEVAEAVLACRQAGIRTVMITGDHKATAMAVARRINLPVEADQVATGSEIEAMTDRELDRSIERLRICARVYPEHKMRLVRALKARGHVVAMTGDGINDAPALKEANIGIAMGIAGTEVAKEASSLVLVDDNFATIAAAVEEGRVIYDNIRKFIRFLLSCNAGEVFTMFFAMLLGFPLPLKAIQILWVNLVTDGLPALALSMEPGSPGIMRRPPRPMREGILERGLGAGIFFTGLEIGVLTLFVFALALVRGTSIEHARTMALATLICVQLLYSLACRTDDSGYTVPIVANLWLVGALAASFSLLGLVIYNPLMQKVFATVPLSLSQWIFIGLVSLVPMLVRRLVMRLLNRRSGL